MFTVDSGILRKAMSRVSAVLSSRNKDLFGFNIGFSKDKLSVSCHNGTEAMREVVHLEVPAEGQDEWSVFVNSDRVSSIVNKESGLIQVGVSKESLEIKSNDASYKLSTSAPRFMGEAWPDSHGDNYMIVDSSHLGRCFSLTGITDSFEVYQQYSMNLVSLSQKDGRMTVFTTDPRRMVLAECDLVEDGWHRDNVTLPDKSCAYAMSIFPEKDKQSSRVRIGVNGNSVIFMSENRTFIGRQAIGRIPDPYKFIRSRSDYEFVYNVEEILSALQRVNSVDDGSGGCVLKLSGDRLSISMATSFGSSSVEVPCSSNGMQSAHRFAPKYIIDFLKRLNSKEQVKIGFNDKSGLIELRCRDAVCMIAKKS